MMISQSRINIICYTLVFQFGICLCQSLLKYRINEEADVGFVLGNINNHVMSNLNEYQPYEASFIHDYFKILPNKDLVIKKRIDLDTFCNEANLCCSGSQCILGFTVLINSKNSQSNPFKIEVEVLDINDNKPTFKNSVQTLNISETSGINTIITIEGGFDNDVSQNNQIQSYKFKEISKTFSFDDNDIGSLNLIQKKPIDYERQRVYTAQLSACDSPTRCVNQSIVINIQDENDNDPTFEKRKYEVKILENFEIGNVVIAARAIDLDGEQFNKTKYGFLSRPDTKFKINQSTGDITLTSKLTALHKQLYSFKLYAIDAGRATTGKKDIVDVVINVLDINDHKPLIEVFQSSKITNDNGIFEMKIMENEKPQKLMSIRVTDADLGLNAKVICELKDHSSSLELKLSDHIYDIYSIRYFDYEQETQIKATFQCNDSGTPPLSSYKAITINIEDVNEFPPAFIQSQFHGSISENTGPGETVLTVRALDKDGAAVLTYSLDESVTQYFAIHPITGVIKTASVSFDREQISSKSFRVTVTDSIVNARSVDAVIHISILDENDNDPVFVPSSLQFYISENQPIRSKLQGQLVANDLDKDISNSFVIFSLIDTFDSELKKCERPYFIIKVNGEVETLSMLDREMNSNFTLTIEAKDRGNPPRNTRANATVIVHDVNDNSPQWMYPRQSLLRQNTIPMLNLTEITERFLLIMQLKALDPDQNEAGRVSYILVNHQHSLFSLNETTGELRTDKSPLPYGQYELQLRAIDHGNPPRNSDSWILINISESGKLANINLTIIIGMVAITALISIFLIVAIICVRRRPRFQQSYLGPTTEVSKDQSNQYFSTNQWMYHATEDNTMPPLSDNDSCLYLSGNFYEQQDPLILHSLTGSRPASRLDYPLILPSSHQANNSEHKFGSQSLLNGERTAGTLRSNTGHYYSIDGPPPGVIINGQELDGDSADSGKGASEVDLRLQYHLNNVTRNYPTMPFPHHSTATSMLGYQASMPDSNYYSINTNPKSFDSRFLTVHPSNLAGKRRVMSPKFNSNNNQCQCFILPEDDIIQLEHDNNQVPMTTFSQQSIANVKSPSSNYHDHNCAYRDDILPPSGIGYYSHCPYTQGPSSRVSTSPVPFSNKESSFNDQETSAGDNLNGDQFESYKFESKKKNNFQNPEQMAQDNNIYTLGLAN